MEHTLAITAAALLLVAGVVLSFLDLGGFLGGEARVAASKRGVFFGGDP